MSEATAGQTDSGSVRYVFLVSLVAALGGLLFGYDTAVISGAIKPLVSHIALDEAFVEGFFARAFDLTPGSLEGFAASSALIGCMIGVACAGFLSDGLGRKKTLVLAAVLFFISAVGTAIPPSLDLFVLLRALGGVGVGAASMTSPVYIAEIAPPKIRGRLVSLNQFAIVFGMFVVYFVNFFIGSLGTEAWQTASGWRWMFGSEAFPALALFVLLFLVPESPRWLTKRGRDDKAFDILKRSMGPQKGRRELDNIQLAISQEEGGLGQVLDRRFRPLLVIGIVLAVLQQVTGINVFLYYAPKIFEGMGATRNVSLLQTIVVGTVNMLFTIVAIYTVDRVGRKPLLVLGSAGMGVALTAIGFAGYFQTTASWVLVFILLYIACFALSLGPVVWVVLSEIYPTRLRGRAIAIATFCLWGANYVVSQTFPMMDESQWLQDRFHGGFPFWVYAAMCVIMVVFVAKFVPETKEKTLEEIEDMFGIADLGRRGA